MAGVLALTLAGGCRLPRPQPRKPNLYKVRGRVIDAETKQGVAGARIRVRATIPTGLGNEILAAYAVADVDGKYRAELSEGFEVLQYASEVQVDASKRGYIPGSADLPPPAKERASYQVPDIVLRRGRVSRPPPELKGLGIPLREPPPPNPIPWKR